jgi:hypothetical protein
MTRTAARASLVCLAACADPVPNTWVSVDAGKAALALADTGVASMLLDEDRPGPPTGDWVEIRTDDYLACALDDAGRPDCWSVRSGEIDSKVPAGPFQAFDVSRSGVLLVYEDGSTTQWPDGVAPLPDGFRWTAVAMGEEVTAAWSCGITAAGDLRCDGVDDAAPDGPYVDLSRAIDTVCGLGEDGVGRCFEPQSGWSPVATLDGPLALLDSNAYAACGLTSAGAIPCTAWGADGDGIVAEAPSDGGWIDVSVAEGAAFACAVSGAGERRCWGNAPDAAWTE